MLAILAKIFKVLNSEQSPSQIAIAISLAAIVGFSPLLSLHNLVVLFVVLIFRVNLTMFLVAWPLLTLFGMLLSPLSQQVGLWLLQLPQLQDTWQDFYNSVVGRWSNFYFSGVIGGLLVGIGVALVMFPISKILVIKYRKEWMEKLEKLHIVKLFKATSFWQNYQQ